MSVVAAAEYDVCFRDSYRPPEDWQKILTDFVGQDEISWTKETKKGFRTLDMKPLIYSFSITEDDHVQMCVCSRVGQNLRPEQLIGEALGRKGTQMPEDALQIRRVDLFAELDPDGVCVRQGDRRKGHEETEETEGQRKVRKLISLGEIGKVIEGRREQEKSLE